jgi:glycine/serine hydroxymethyltransferase
MDGEIEETTQYSYDSTKVSLFSPRDEVIQSIMRIKYKDIDSEFAARLNGGTDEEAHAAWRVVAKGVADEFTAYVESELNT